MNVKLKMALVRRQVKQVDLANKLNISESLLSKYINGRQEMPENIKGKIAQVLGIKKDDLF